MTTTNTKKENTHTQRPPEVAGSLADSARRHLAYEALSHQLALSEAALQRVLEAIARCQGAAGEAGLERESHERGDWS